MKHAETLIARLLFLEGNPVVSKLSPIHIGGTVPKIMDYDLEAELGAVKLYNGFVKLCVEAGDKGSAEVFDHLLQDEERHLDWLEAQKDQIAQMTLPNYLATQAR
jgi:bacterioferritin